MSAVKLKVVLKLYKKQKKKPWLYSTWPVAYLNQ
jgi:hypothetical protein